MEPSQPNFIAHLPVPYELSSTDKTIQPKFLQPEDTTCAMGAFTRICAPRIMDSHFIRRLLLGVLALAAVLLFTRQSRAQEPMAAATVARFDVFEYRVEGNSVLAVELVERAVYPFLGEKRSVDDVEAARVALENAYRYAGFGTVLVDTPEQQIVDGVVVLHVIQAPVSRLRVVGARFYSQGKILDKVPALAEGKVPNFKEVTEQLAGVNRTADRRVTPLLRPGKATGTTEVDLMVEDKSPFHGNVEINNKYSANTTPTRLQASLRYDNLWQREHSIGFQWQTSPENTSEVRVLSGSYTVPAENGLWSLSFIRSDSNTVAGVGSTTVFGRGSIYGLRRVLILPSDTELSQTLTLGFDRKSFMESVSVGPNQGFETPIHYVPFTAGYASSRMDKKGAWQLGSSVTFALRGLGSNESQFADKRYQGQSNFSVIKFDVARTQFIPSGLTLFGKLNGQVSTQPLISNEQFVAGGADSVRGYLDASAVGDNGLRGSLELRSSNLATDGMRGISGLTALAFMEGAGLWLRSPLPQQDARSGLLGTGVGLRLQSGSSVSFGVDLAWALRDAGTTRRGDLRLHANGVVEF